MTQPTSTSTTATGSDPVIDVVARLVGEVIGQAVALGGPL